MRVGPRLVHIVEDNATFRKTIEGRLKEFGYEGSTYPSAQHFLYRLASDDAPSCILLDVRLPGMSGPELQERLNALGSTLPIIFLTGYSDIPTTVRTMKAGGEDFLVKAVSWSSFFSPSNELLRGTTKFLTRADARRRSVSCCNIDTAPASGL